MISVRIYFSITTRITAIEHSGGGSGGDSDNLYVSRSLKLAYTTPNTSAWIDSNNFVVSSKFICI